MRRGGGALLGILLCLAVGHAAGEAKEPWNNDAPLLTQDLPEAAFKEGGKVQGKGKSKAQDRGAETEYGFGFQQREFAEHPVFPGPLLLPPGNPLQTALPLSLCSIQSHLAHPFCSLSAAR